MTPQELISGARDLSSRYPIGDVVRVHTGEAGATAELVDTSRFVMEGLLHAVAEGRQTLETAQTQLDNFFPDQRLSLIRYSEVIQREKRLRISE